MLDGIRLPAASGIDLGEWRRALREGRCEIDLRGGSHVFVPTATDGLEVTDVSEIPGAPGAFQEVFGRAALKRLLIAYWKGQNTADIRRSLGAHHVDIDPTWRRPGTGPYGSARTQAKNNGYQDHTPRNEYRCPDCFGNRTGAATDDQSCRSRSCRRVGRIAGAMGIPRHIAPDHTNAGVNYV